MSLVLEFLFYFGLFHLVVADELSIASVGFHQDLVASSLPHLAILQKQNVITELQILTDTSEDNHVNQVIQALSPKVYKTQSKQPVSIFVDGI